MSDGGKTWDAAKWAAERASSYNGPKIKFWNNTNSRNGAPTCPWAHRSFIALIEKGLPFEERVVDLLDKPADFKGMYESIAADPLARAKVPILELGDEGSQDYVKLIESGVVTEFIAENWKNMGADLLPSEGAATARKAKMNFFVQTFMETVQGSNISFLTANSTQRVQSEYMRLLNGLKATDVCLQKHGEQKGDGAPFFLGGQYSLAEVQTAPFVARMQASFKENRDVDIMETCKQLGLTNMASWWNAVLERPSTKLTTPDNFTNSQLAPYVRPVFVPYKFSAAEQQANCARAQQAWNTGEGREAEEASRKAEMQKGVAMAQAERAKKNEAERLQAVSEGRARL